MKEKNWMNEIHQQDKQVPTQDVGSQPVYTVYLRDFLRMPDVNFLELAVIDPAIRALLN